MISAPVRLPTMYAEYPEKNPLEDFANSLRGNHAHLLLECAGVGYSVYDVAALPFMDRCGDHDAAAAVCSEFMEYMLERNEGTNAVVEAASWSSLHFFFGLVDRWLFTRDPTYAVEQMFSGMVVKGFNVCGLEQAALIFSSGVLPDMITSMIEHLPTRVEAMIMMSPFSPTILFIVPIPPSRKLSFVYSAFFVL